MKRNIRNTTNISKAVIVGAIFAMGAGFTFAQESTEDLVRKLRGQAGAKPEAGKPAVQSKFKTRGLGTRGITPSTATPKVETETRSLYFSKRGTRGIPTAIQAAAEDDKIQLTTTTAKASTGAGAYSVAAGEEAIEVKYTVDPQSKVTRDNILFKKGKTDFADQGSFDVIVQLATALKDPSLSGLKYVVEGHASAEGSAYANQNLSQRRAEYIVQVMGSLGVSPHRLLPIGFGESQARFPDYSQEMMLRQDRRVVIYRLEH